MLLAGFAVLAVEPPDPSIQLHEALVRGDERTSEVLEAQLEWKRTKRKLQLTAFFAGSVLLTVTGFLSIAPSTRPADN